MIFSGSVSENRVMYERGAHRYERALDPMNYKIKAPLVLPDYEREVDETLSIREEFCVAAAFMTTRHYLFNIFLLPLGQRAEAG